MLELLRRLYESTLGGEELIKLAWDCSPWNDIPDGYERKIVYSKLRESLKTNEVSRGDWPLWLNSSKSTQQVAGYIQSVLDESNSRMIDDELRFEVDSEILDIARSPKDTKKRVGVLLEKLRAYPIGKRDGSGYFPESSYAIRESEDPKTWSFRIAESDGKPYGEGISDAMRFVVVSCKEGKDLDKAMKVKDAVERLRIESSFKNRIPIREQLNITEAPTKGSGVIKIVAIQPGLTVGGERFYSREALAESLPLFEGAKMFANHATEQQDFEHPEGDLNRWVAILEGVRLGRGGEIRGNAIIVDPVFKEKVDLLIEQGKIEELKVSINAIGEGSFEEIDSIEVFAIRKILAVRSVDFVTEANAGGTSLLESLSYTDDVDLISIESFIERRPDIVKLIESTSTTEKDDELMNMEQRFEKLEEALETHKEESTKEIVSLKEQLAVEKKEKEELKAGITAKESSAVIQAHIDGIKDVEDSLKEHLTKRYGKRTDSEDAIKQIDEDVKMFAGKKVKESADVTDEGESENGEEGEEGEKNEGHKSLVEAYTKRFIREGLAKDEATERAELMAG